PTEILFSLGVGFFILCGILKPADAWRCFSNPAVFAVGGLLVITAGLRSTGVLDSIGRSLFGNVRSERGLLARLAAVVIGSSAFLLNTAIVAMLMPQVVNWCRSRRVSPSRLLLPISYLAILGGTCTLVGTSTNLIVNNELKDLDGRLTAISDNGDWDFPKGDPLQKFDTAWLQTHFEEGRFQPMVLTDITWVGLPCAVIGALSLLLFGRFLVPNRTELLESLDERRREYLVEMLVTEGCALVGKTVEEGGLRNLPGLFLIEIVRDHEVIAPVTPSDRIAVDDRLVFTGIVSTIVDLEKINGLVPAADINYQVGAEPGPNRRRSMVEVVLSPSSPLVGRSVRKANFRRLYGAAVVAVHRNGERLPSKIGDIELTSGDTLLLQTTPGFVKNFRNRHDFYLVSDVQDSESRRYQKTGWAIAITLGLIAWLFAMPWLPQLHQSLGLGVPLEFLTDPSAAIFIAALGMIVTRCLSAADARNAIDLPMLMTIGAAIALGTAVQESQADLFVAGLIQRSVGTNTYLGLAAIFFLTILFTEMISNA
ncbi:MAG: SLC13 family permease, partial [Planctomycetota bacterium]